LAVGHSLANDAYFHTTHIFGNSQKMFMSILESYS